MSTEQEPAQLDVEGDHYIDSKGVILAAMLKVLTKRLGVAFATDVRDMIVVAAENLAVSDDPEDRRDAPLVRQVADRPIFGALGVISDSDPKRD